MLNGFTTFYVQGTGTPPPAVVEPAVPSNEHVVAQGTGMGCKGMGSMVVIEGWSSLDAAIEAEGAALAAQGSTDVVTVVVSGPISNH